MLLQDKVVPIIWVQGRVVESGDLFPREQSCLLWVRYSGSPPASTSSTGEGQRHWLCLHAQKEGRKGGYVWGWSVCCSVLRNKPHGLLTIPPSPLPFGFYFPFQMYFFFFFIIKDETSSWKIMASLHMYRKMHSLLQLHCTESGKLNPSDIASVSRRIWVYSSPFLFIFFFCRVLQFWLLFSCILIIN